MDREALLSHRSFVRALARSLVRDASRACDVEQETWLYAISRPPRIATSVRGWLASCVRSVARQQGRADARREARERAVAPAPPAEPTADLVAREVVRRRLVQAVLELEEPYRSAILLRYLEDLPVRHVARRLGVPVETARTRVRRGVERLRVRLEPELGEGRAFASVLVPLTGSGESIGVTAASIVEVTMKLPLAIGAAAGVLVAIWFLSGYSLEGPSRDPVRLAGVAAEASPLGPNRPTEDEEPRASEIRPVELEREVAAAEDDARRVVAVRGTVLDDLGRGISGARILVYPAGHPTAIEPGTASLDEHTRLACSDAAGSFHVADLPPGRRHRVMASAEGYASTWSEPIATDQSVTLVLPPALRVIGRAVAADGAAIPGATVCWAGVVEGVAVLRETSSDLDGVYVLEDVPGPRGLDPIDAAARWSLEAFAQGYAPLALERRFDTIVAREGTSTIEQDLVLVRGARLEGRVIDDFTGAPIADAGVWVASRGSPERVRAEPGRTLLNPYGDRCLGAVRTDADGRFAVEHLPADGFHERPMASIGEEGLVRGKVVVWAPGYAAATAPLRCRPDGMTGRLELRLRPAATVTGRVVDSVGAPIEGAHVRSLRATASAIPAFLDGVVPGRSERTDREGRYRLVVPVPAGDDPVEVLGSATGYVWDVVPVPVVSGRSAAAPDHVLGTDVMFVARVVDEERRPLLGARIGFDYSVVDHATTDEHGAARIARSGRVPDSVEMVRFRAEMKGYAPALSEPFSPCGAAEGDSVERTIVLRRGLPIAGRILTAAGEPVAGARVDVRAVDIPPEPHALRDRIDHCGRVARVESDWDGSFRCDELADGAYRVRASATLDGRSVQADWIEAPAGACELVVRLPDPSGAGRRSALEGRVLRARDGAPIASFEATLTRSDAARARPVQARRVGLGRFLALDLEPGTWTVRITSRDHAGWEGNVVIGAAASTTLDVRLLDGATVEGRIGPLCEPPGRWRVTFEPLDGGLPVDVSVADDGAFVARGLMPGRYVPRLRGLFPTLPSGVCADPSLPLDVPEGVEHLRRDIRIIERPAHVSIRVPGDPEPYRRVGSVEIRTDAGVLLHRGDVWTQDPTRYVVPPGEVVIRAEPDDGDATTTRMTVGPGGVSNFAFPSARF